MPDEEKDEANENEQEEPGEASANLPTQTVSFPLGMAFVALFFDLLERLVPLLIPGIGLIMGYWQKIYAPNTDPVLGFFFSKIAALITMGLLPDNLSIVIFAFIKKRSAAKQKSPAIKLPEPAEQTA